MAILQWLAGHLEVIAIGVVDAVLMLVPSVKSNNVIQLVVNCIKAISDALSSKINPPQA